MERIPGLLCLLMYVPRFCSRSPSAKFHPRTRFVVPHTAAAAAAAATAEAETQQQQQHQQKQHTRNRNNSDNSSTTGINILIGRKKTPNDRVN